jgi:hypothetical protein
MIERTSKLRRKIFAWIDVQIKFFPALTNIREREDAARVRVADSQPAPGIKVSDITLWLPSAMAAAPGPDAQELTINLPIFNHEYRLRVGQASEALHEIRRLLLVRTHLYKLKDTHSRGVRENMRSGDKIAALNEQVKRAAASYRVARKALVVLGKTLREYEWEWTLLELKADDVRGLPQSHFSNPDHKKRKRKNGKTKPVEREISWIWLNKGEKWDPSDDAAMNEGTWSIWRNVLANDAQQLYVSNGPRYAHARCVGGKRSTCWKRRCVASWRS